MNVKRLKRIFLFPFKGMGLATKQFIGLFFVTLILFSSLLWINLRESEEVFKTQELNHSQELMARSNQFLNAYIDNIQHTLLVLSTQYHLLEDGQGENARQFLRDYGDFNRSTVRTLYLIREDGQVYSSRQVHYDILGNPHLSHLMEISQENYGAINWSEPYYSPVSGDTLGFVRPITDNHNEVIGIAVIEINLDQLTDRMSSHLDNENQTMMIMTAANNIVTADLESSFLPYDKDSYPHYLDSVFLDQLSQLPEGVKEIDDYEYPMVVVKSKMNRLGWSLISLTDQSYFYQNVSRIYDNYSAAILIWVIILLISSFMITRYFTKPIRQLVTEMDKVEDMKSMSTIPVERDDEIGRLTYSYNSLIRRIKELFLEVKQMEERKKEYELRMLQSQIGPHFLYNTLGCISSLARQKKIDKVRETIRSLVKLLSFSFDRSQQYITLREELEGVQAYTQIQQVRYGDKFILNMDVDPHVLDCKILRLTIQPLVENAIFHGIIPKGHHGSIWVKARIYGEHLRIYVRDNGLGMQSEQYRKLLQNIVNERLDSSLKEGFNSIGLVNVQERIQINFGSQYGLRIMGRQNVGTIVRITIPIILKSKSS